MTHQQGRGVSPEATSLSDNDTDSGVFAVIAEFKDQAPILMETEGDQSSLSAARDRMQRMAGRPDVIRVCIVRLVNSGVWSGNQTLLAAMRDMQQ